MPTLIQKIDKFLAAGNRSKWSNLTKSPLWSEVVAATAFLSGNIAIPLRVWYILTDTKDQLRCVCDNELTDWNRGLKQPFYACSNRCHIQRTLPAKTNTNKERYGGSSPAASPKVLEKMQTTSIKKYGVPNASSSQQIKDRRAKTLLERYGVDHFWKSKESVRQKKEYFQSLTDEQWQTRVRGLKKSGVRYKEYVWPSGNIVKVQGAEPKALDQLLQEGYHETDVMVGRNNIPMIRFDVDGSVHRFFPDIFIPKENLIIEVKSTFTYNIDYENNQRKEHYTRLAGYNFRWLIY